MRLLEFFRKIALLRRCMGANTIDIRRKTWYDNAETFFGGERAVKANAPRTKGKGAGGWTRRLWMGLMTGCMVVITALGFWPSDAVVETAEAAPGRDGRVVMYVMDDASFSWEGLDADRVDQVNYAFALLKNGEATSDHWMSIRQASAWLKKHPGVEGVLSVGGWGADGFSQACATSEGREKLANSLVALMDEHGFMGIDIDWEYPGSKAGGIAASDKDEENWYSLLALLRKQLDAKEAEDGRKRLLSVAVGAGAEQLKRVDGARLNGLVDQVVLMAYDLSFFNKTTAHHAGLYPSGEKADTGAWAVNKLLESGLEADKLLLGVPAYGRVWRQVSGGGNGLGQRAATSGNKAITFDEMQRLSGEGYEHYYDETAQAGWYFNHQNFVSGEDEQSLAAKGGFIRQKGLLGAAVWCWNQDPSSAMLTMLDAALTP